METGRRNARPRLVRAAPTAARLADVVCRARIVPAKPVVHSDGDLFTRRQIGCHPALRTQPLSGASAALRSRNCLSLSFHDKKRTSANWRVVETPGTGRVFTDCFARAISLRSPISFAERSCGSGSPQPQFYQVAGRENAPLYRGLREVFPRIYFGRWQKRNRS